MTRAAVTRRRLAVELVGAALVGVLAFMVVSAATGEHTPPTRVDDPAPPDAPMTWTEGPVTRCPNGMLALDYEGVVFEVGVDRIRPEWGTYEPWTCLGIEPGR